MVRKPQSYNEATLEVTLDRIVINRIIYMLPHIVRMRSNELKTDPIDLIDRIDKRQQQRISGLKLSQKYVGLPADLCVLRNIKKQDFKQA
ncbi:MAG: hypothetical protein GX811_03485 [Lentisphaerae bacterium]|nr:hypothetical protein [Lentisphaerota bacterium]